MNQSRFFVFLRVGDVLLGHLLHKFGVAPLLRTTMPAAALPSEDQLKGTSVVAGGILAHFILGTMYCWGNFLSYAPQSLLFFDGLAHPGLTPDAVQVMPLGLIALNVGMPVGAWTNKKYGPKLTTLVGCSLMVLGTFLGSFMTRLAPFMLCYSLLAGFGTGMSYSTPMQAGWTWFPQTAPRFK